MRIIFFGTPAFAVPSLHALLKAGADIAAVVTQPDRAKGRGHAVSPPPVKEAAVAAGLQVLQPATVKNEDFFRELSRHRPEIIVVVAYGKIIPPRILALPPLGCINVHASLLPKYRGAAPIQWALINGERKTGITTMMMDEGLDTGGILLQEELAIEKEDNALTLSKKLAELGSTLLVQTLNSLYAQTIKPVPQKGEATFAPPLKKESGRIDWRRPAEEIHNLVRGTYPWPGAYFFIKDEKVTVLSTAVADEENGHLPGRIAEIRNREILVSAGKGLLSVIELRPQGKQSMDAASFARGRRLQKGSLLEA